MLVYVTEVSKGTMLVNPAHIVTAIPTVGGIRAGTQLTLANGTILLLAEDLATINRRIDYAAVLDDRVPVWHERIPPAAGGVR